MKYGCFLGVFPVFHPLEPTIGRRKGTTIWPKLLEEFATHHGLDPSIDWIRCMRSEEGTAPVLFRLVRGAVFSWKKRSQWLSDHYLTRATWSQLRIAPSWVNV